MSTTEDNKDTKSREARDLEILIIAWKTSKVAPVVDNQALADAGLWKNASTAQVSFGKLRRRLFGADWKPNTAAEGATGSVTPTKKAATPRKRKVKATDENEVGEDGVEVAVGEKPEEEGEPAKKKAKKATKGEDKGKQAKAEEIEEEITKEEEEGEEEE